MAKDIGVRPVAEARRVADQPAAEMEKCVRRRLSAEIRRRQPSRPWSRRKHQLDLGPTADARLPAPPRLPLLTGSQQDPLSAAQRNRKECTARKAGRECG